MKIYVLDAVVGDHLIPLCYANSEKEMIEDIRGTQLYSLYQQENIWLDEFDFPINRVKNFVHVSDYIKMYT